jgi:hypothetical protein
MSAREGMPTKTDHLEEAHFLVDGHGVDVRLVPVPEVRGEPSGGLFDAFAGPLPVGQVHRRERLVLGGRVGQHERRGRGRGGRSKFDSGSGCGGFGGAGGEGSADSPWSHSPSRRQWGLAAKNLACLERASDK